MLIICVVCFVGGVFCADFVKDKFNMIKEKVQGFLK